ncbi:hypothetical protein MHU86_16752 [Fragilaria crotonensis]|nr:hypothetical protein MHU86_16752 [Fragilaria crotonensis]
MKLSRRPNTNGTGRRLLFACILIFTLVGSLVDHTEAAACQACLFSIPLAATQRQFHNNHRPHVVHPFGARQVSSPSVLGVRAHLVSALIPFGVVATRYFAGPRYKSWLLHADETTKIKKDNDDDNDEDEKQVLTPDAALSSAAIGALRFYKGFISPLLPPACRFVPTCSQYGVQAIQEFGTTRGCILIAWRLLRCSPVGGKGYDPPKWPPVPFTYSSY